MQTQNQSLFQKTAMFLFAALFCVNFSPTIANDLEAYEAHKLLDKDVKLTFNGKEISLKSGIQFAEIKKGEANMLLIEINSECLDDNPKISLFLAKGARPIAKADVKDFAAQPRIDLTNFLSQANPGDRIVIDFNNEERIISFPIT